MLDTVQLPWPLRLGDSIHSTLWDAGLPTLRMEPQALRRRARSKTGLHDFGDPRFQEGLQALCSSVEQSVEQRAGLNLFGRKLVNEVALTALSNRLRRIALQEAQPELFSAPLNRPVIVVGLPRTGTTYLHRLLSLGPDTRALKTWEVRAPLPGSGPDLRRLQNRVLLNLIRRAAPALDRKHHLGADAAEECVFLLEDSFESLSFWMMFPVYSYLKWLQAQDGTAAYEVYRAYLQIFQAQTPDKRLVLKAPAHSWHLKVLMDAVPEAQIIYTHRAPEPVVGSMNSLFHTLFSLVSKQVDHERYGQLNLDLLVGAAQNSMADRAHIDADRLMDIRYPALFADPTGTVAAICEHTGLAFHEELVRTRVQERTQRLYGHHEYSLEETGLSSAQVQERFSAYRERFGV